MADHTFMVHVFLQMSLSLNHTLAQWSYENGKIIVLENKGIDHIHKDDFNDRWVPQVW